MVQDKMVDNMILDGTTESVVSPLYKEEILGLLYLNVLFCSDSSNFYLTDLMAPQKNLKVFPATCLQKWHTNKGNKEFDTHRSQQTRIS